VSFREQFSQHFYITTSGNFREAVSLGGMQALAGFATWASSSTTPTP